MEEEVLRKLIKIGCIGFMLLTLVGCSSKKEGAQETTHIATPTEQVNDNVNDGSKDQEPLNQEPQGDFAENVIIALDAGHGGGFSGASYDGLVEKNLTLTVANEIKSYLEENYTGMEVYLVRDKDSALSGDVAQDLEMRAEYAKSVSADALISLHFNASEDHSQQGAMVLISHQDNVTEVSDELAHSILDELAALGIADQGTRTRNSNDMFDEDGNPLDYYAINRHCAKRDIPGIIVEHCFMDNDSDKAFIKSEEKLKELAKADAIGIANYYGLAKK